MAIIDQINSHFLKIIESEWPHLSETLDIAETQNPSFGDYQVNSAMKIAKAQKIAPRKAAETIVHKLGNDPLFSKVEIAGPGFINLTLADSLIENELKKMIGNERFGIAPPQEKKRVLVEFSSPNVAKELHVGHLRSTIIGDCLARLFEFLGYEVLRVNHVGDYGTQFGMLIAHLKEKSPDLKDASISFLLTAYKESKVRFDSDPEFKKRSQQEVVRLQANEPESIALWTKIVEISRKSYQEIYDLLEVKLIEKGESSYRGQIPSVIQELEEKNLLTISEGAKCLFIDEIKNREGTPMPLMVQKSDGGFGYDTTDLAAIRFRILEEKADRIIYVTDLGQELHFKLIFKAAIRAGWADPEKVRLDHVGFGLVLGPSGKKLKTREGETEKLIDLLTAAEREAGKILETRTTNLSSNEKKELAKKLGLSAVKYIDLSSHRISDYIFSYEKMLRFEGNTAAFLFYSHVRCQSILNKLGNKKDLLLLRNEIAITHPQERELALHIVRFEEMLREVANDLLPHRLADYLFHLAEKFNLFFRDCRVEGSKEEAARAKLCSITAQIFETGFKILGLFPVEKM